MSNTPKCYSCKRRGQAVGSAHSTCSVPEDLMGTDKFIIAMLVLSGSHKVRGIEFNEHGVKMGWCSWPIDFDPVWINSCSHYLPKEDDKTE